MPVPSFTLDGILPPFTGDPTDGATMSPFKVTVLEFVASFALTRQRVQILEGFLEFRRRIHELGITRGVQWIDGSFAWLIGERGKRRSTHTRMSSSTGR